MEKKIYLKATFSEDYCRRYSGEIFERAKGEIIGFELIETYGETTLGYNVSFGYFTEFISEKSIKDGLFSIVEKYVETE